jgi:amphiphysin
MLHVLRFLLFLASVDDQFKVYENQFKLLEEEVTRLLGDVRQYRTAITTLISHQNEIGNSLKDIYAPISSSLLDDGPSIQTSVPADSMQAVDTYVQITNPVFQQISGILYNFDERVINPLTTLAGFITSIRKLINKRYHKLIDYDRHKTDVDKFKAKQNRDISDEKKLHKSGQAFEIAEREYKDINNLLMDEIPILIEEKQNFIIPMFYIIYQYQLEISAILFNSMEEMKKCRTFDFSKTAKQGFKEKEGNLTIIDDMFKYNTFSPSVSPSSGVMARISSLNRSKSTRSANTSPNDGNGSPRLSPAAPAYSHSRSTSSPNPAPSFKRSPPPPPPKAFNKVYVKAIYDYAAQDSGDLTFKTNDVIEVVEKTESTNDWWVGKLNGKSGNFPANYVTMM